MGQTVRFSTTTQRWWWRETSWDFTN